MFCSSLGDQDFKFRALQKEWFEIKSKILHVDKKLPFKSFWYKIYIPWLFNFQDMFLQPESTGGLEDIFFDGYTKVVDYFK